MVVSIYSYEELFELIRIQKEKEKKDIKEPTQMEKIISEGLRTLNNPTSQNFRRTMGVIVNTDKNEDKQSDNRLNYIYRAS